MDGPLDGVETMEYEFVCADPVLGEVSFDTEAEAFAYSAAIDGIVYRRTWVGGQIVKVERADEI
jgi:hypothetical protein